MRLPEKGREGHQCEVEPETEEKRPEEKGQMTMPKLKRPDTKAATPKLAPKPGSKPKPSPMTLGKKSKRLK